MGTKKIFPQARENLRSETLNHSNLDLKAFGSFHPDLKHCQTQYLTFLGWIYKEGFGVPRLAFPKQVSFNDLEII